MTGIPDPAVNMKRMTNGMESKAAYRLSSPRNFMMVEDLRRNLRRKKKNDVTIAIFDPDMASI